MADGELLVGHLTEGNKLMAQLNKKKVESTHKDIGGNRTKTQVLNRRGLVMYNCIILVLRVNLLLL